MELQVINEITAETKTFKSIEEFNLFYQKHKDEMNKHTTHYLNRVYKIITPDGDEYKITKQNCLKESGKIVGRDIYLRKVFKGNKLKELQEDIIKADIEVIKNDVKLFADQLNELHMRIDNVIPQMQKQIEQSDKKILELTSTVNQIAKYINDMNNV